MRKEHNESETSLLSLSLLWSSTLSERKHVTTDFHSSDCTKANEWKKNWVTLAAFCLWAWGKNTRVRQQNVY